MEDAAQAAQQSATGTAAVRFAVAARLAATTGFATTGRLTTAAATAQQAETRTGVRGAAEHDGDAQDERQKGNTSVHRETPNTDNGRETHTSVPASHWSLGELHEDLVPVARKDRYGARPTNQTLPTSSVRIVLPSSLA